MKPEFGLCYVKGCFAYFTSQPVEEQWGDDWNDAPYEHNAGEPYGPCWHNEPAHRNDPNAKRGWKPGTEEPLAVGEVCRCPSCVRDWNEDGTPKYEIRILAFTGPYETPDSGCLNSIWSVQQINRREIAWLRDPWSGKGKPILAGDSIEEFKRKMKEAGGTVYEPTKD